MVKRKQIQLLIATMHQKDYALLDKMHIDSDAIVVNQCDRELEEQFEYNGHKIHWINSVQRGLSRSRNMALRTATADICVIGDDDMEYRNGYADMILSAFEEKPEADILRFQVQGIERTFKAYPNQARKLGYLGSMRISSVEIAFRREAVVGKKIQFDELIGAGTQFPMGEENAFLFDCLRNRLKMYYVPQVIADLHIGNSTWFNGYNERFFIGYGAAVTAMDRRLSGLFRLQFAIRKYRRYKKECSFVKAVSGMRQGKKQYLQQKKALKG